MTDTAAFIDTEDQLNRFCADIAEATWLAIDTEFIREKTYYPQWCLLQVAAPDGQIACIDTLAIKNLQPIMDLLFDPTITVILHAASQDMELFYHHSGRLPAPLFDTQIAAGLAGHGDQIGYGNLVQAALGISLEKGHARCDWSRRPLATDELRYAADDVRHLGALYEKLCANLEKRGRLHWLDAEFSSYSSPERYAPNPERAWKRLRGLNRLKPVQQQLGAKLASWRETEAMRANRPRKWIIGDETLIDIARRPPRDLADLAKLRDLGQNRVEKYGQTLLQIAQDTANLPNEALITRERRLAPTQEPLVDVLMAVLRERARENDLSVAALGKRADLEAIIAGQEDVALLKGWRLAAAGETLLSVLQNKTAVSIRDGRLVLQEAE